MLSPAIAGSATFLVILTLGFRLRSTLGYASFAPWRGLRKYKLLASGFARGI